MLKSDDQLENRSWLSLAGAALGPGSRLPIAVLVVAGNVVAFGAFSMLAFGTSMRCWSESVDSRGRVVASLPVPAPHGPLVMSPGKAGGCSDDLIPPLRSAGVIVLLGLFIGGAAKMTEPSAIS